MGAEDRDNDEGWRKLGFKCCMERWGRMRRVRLNVSSVESLKDSAISELVSGLSEWSASV